MKTISDVLANQALFDDARVATLCADAKGRLLWSNDLFAHFYCGVPAEQATGRLFHEFVDRTLADERVEIFRTTITHSARTIVYEVWNGLAIEALLQPLAPHADAPDGCVLAMFRREPSLSHNHTQGRPLPEPGEVRVIRTRAWHLGPLAALSRRELEILSLIGEGLSNAHIAELIHRTVKTVEFHRASISAKSGIEGRVNLARAAQQACLYERLRGAGYRVPESLELTPNAQPA